MFHLAKLASALVIVLMPAVVSAEDRFFDSNGVRIRYVDQGSGEPVVFVHGFSSNIETAWITPGVFSNLAKDHRAIALDLRGRGKSDKPRNAEAYGEEVVLDVVRLLDHLRIERAHIVGYSMGGNIVAKLLTTSPDRFITATLGGSAGRRNWNAEDDRAAEAEALEFERGTPFRSVILRTWPTDQAKPSEETIQQQSQDRITRGNDPAVFAADVRGRHAQAVTDAELAAVSVPTLAIVGAADANLASVNELKLLLPSLKVVIINGATHAGERGVTARPEFVSAIRDFISANQQKSSR
jgi:pimeloyl-ACP methyl ester carboxylesterase